MERLNQSIFVSKKWMGFLVVLVALSGFPCVEANKSGI